MGNELNIINNKQIIVYLAGKFPNCFVINGNIKPLKLGIFQDIVELLKDDLPISKTQLRAALRSYTSSYQYLEAIKPDKMRVNLQGEPCEKMSDSHVTYAQQTLAERKVKREMLVKKKVPQTKNNPFKTKENTQSKVKPTNKVSKVHLPKPKIELTQLKIGERINISIGKSIFNVILLEIVDETLKVELPTGLVVTVNKSVLQ